MAVTSRCIISWPSPLRVQTSHSPLWSILACTSWSGEQRKTPLAVCSALHGTRDHANRTTESFWVEETLKIKSNRNLTLAINHAPKNLDIYCGISVHFPWFILEQSEYHVSKFILCFAQRITLASLGESHAGFDERRTFPILQGVIGALVLCQEKGTSASMRWDHMMPGDP